MTNPRESTWCCSAITSILYFDHDDRSPRTVTGAFRIAATLVLAGWRVRTGPKILASAIVGLAFAALLILLTLPSVAGDLTVRHQLNGLTPSDRSVSVVVSPERRPTEAERKQFDATVRKRLSVPGYGAVTRVTSFRSLSSPQGSLYRLTATENIESALRLVSGRWPKTCTPSRCEVLSVGAASVARSGRGKGTTDLADVAYLRVVGRATPGPTFPFVGALAPSSGELLVVADGPDAVQNVTTLDLIRRVNGWIAPIEPSEVSRASVAALLDGAARIGEELGIAGVSVAIPSEELEDAVARSEFSTRTIAIVGAQLLALLAVGCAVAGFALRQNHLLAYDRLKRRGANRATQRWFASLSGLMVVLVGLVFGVLLGVGGAALVARFVEVRISDTLRELTRVRSVVAMVVAVLLVALIVGAAMNDRADRPVIRLGRIRLGDVGAIIAAGLVAVGVFTGGNRTNSGSGDAGVGSGLWWWPVVATAGLVWFVWRLLPILLRVGNTFRKRSCSSRTVAQLLNTRSLSRQRVSLTGAALAAIAAAVSVFAIGTRSTLAQGATDQAGYSVPLQFRLRVGSSLVRPDELRTAATWKSMQRKLVDTDVVRRTVTVLGGTGDGAVEVLGVNPSALSALSARSNRRGDYGPRDISARLQSPKPAPVGQLISLDAKTIQVAVSGDYEILDFALVVERTNGTWHELKLKQANPNVLSTALEPGDAGGRLLGYRVGLNSFFAEQIEHKIGEGNAFTGESSANIAIQSPISMPGDRRIDLSAASLASEQAIVRSSSEGSLEVRLALQGSSALILPTGVVEPIPALVDQQTAEIAGGIGEVVFVETLQRRMEFRVAAVARRFPTMGDRFLIADVGQVARQFNLAQPGFGTPTEAWLSSTNQVELRNALTSAPLNQLLVDDRASIERQLRSDPLRRMAVAILIAAGLIGALVTVAGLAISALSDTADQVQFRHTLRLEGISERFVQRAIGWRTLLAAVLLLPVGCGTGVLLLHLTARDVGAGASSIVEGLPLRFPIPLTLVAFAMAALTAMFALASHVGARGAAALEDENLLRGRS
jgi:hypothetical protein